VRDVAIPVALQDAMSRQAQAEREKQVRVILGSAEDAIAGKFVEAANGWCARREALIECDPSPAVCTILLMIEIFSPGNLALRQEALNLRIFEARLACRTQEHKNKSLKRKT
jgi:hypothetical protein